MSIQWTWTIVTAVGALVLTPLALEAWKDFQFARAKGERRLVLNTLIAWQMMAAKLALFVLFAGAGVLTLVGMREVVAPVLIVAVGQFVVVAYRARRNQRRLFALIEVEIRERKRKERK